MRCRHSGAPAGWTEQKVAHDFVAFKYQAVPSRKSLKPFFGERFEKGIRERSQFGAETYGSSLFFLGVRAKFRNGSIPSTNHYGFALFQQVQQFRQSGLGFGYVYGHLFIVTNYLVNLSDESGP